MSTRIRAAVAALVAVLTVVMVAACGQTTTEKVRSLGFEVVSEADGGIVIAVTPGGCRAVLQQGAVLRLRSIEGVLIDDEVPVEPAALEVEAAAEKAGIECPPLAPTSPPSAAHN